MEGTSVVKDAKEASEERREALFGVILDEVEPEVEEAKTGIPVLEAQEKLPPTRRWKSRRLSQSQISPPHNQPSRRMPDARPAATRA